MTKKINFYVFDKNQKIKADFLAVYAPLSLYNAISLLLLLCKNKEGYDDAQQVRGK